MIGAWKYGEPSMKDWLVVALGSIGLAAFALPIDPKMVFVWFAIAVTIPLVAQLLKLYDAGERGVVSGELLATFLVKNTFFTLFAFTLEGGEPVLKWWAPVWLIVSLWLVVKWLLCPKSLK
jgi:hypothetical protein